MPFGYACDRCRQKHQSCDHQFPCQRCIKANCGDGCHYTPKRARTRKAASAGKVSALNGVSSASASSLSPTSASSVFAGPGDLSLGSRSRSFFDANFPGAMPVNEALYEYGMQAGGAMHPTGYLQPGLQKVATFNGQTHYLIPATQHNLYQQQQQQLRLSYREGGQVADGSRNGSQAHTEHGQHPAKYPMGPGIHGLVDARVYPYDAGGAYAPSYGGHSLMAGGLVSPTSTPVSANPHSLSRLDECTRSVPTGDYGYPGQSQFGAPHSAPYLMSRNGSHGATLPTIYQNAMLPYDSGQSFRSNCLPMRQTENGCKQSYQTGQNGNGAQDEFPVQSFDFSEGKSGTEVEGQLAKGVVSPVNNNHLYENGLCTVGPSEEIPLQSTYPSSELLDGIHYSASRLYESMNDSNPRYYAYDSSALLASGVLVQEYVKEALTFITDDLRLAETIPNSSGMQEGDLFNDFIDQKQPYKHANQTNGSNGQYNDSDIGNGSYGAAKANGKSNFPDHTGNSNGYFFKDAKDHTFLGPNDNDHSQSVMRVSQNVPNAFPAHDYGTPPPGSIATPSLSQKYPISNNGSVLMDYGQAHYPPYLHL